MPQNAKPTEATVLLVEPDVLVRITLAAYLRECGYEVIECGNATTVLRHERYVIQAMLTDAQLPGTLDGFTLAQRARQDRPEMKVLIAASPERAAAIAGTLCEDGPLLSKPYAQEIVADRIRQLLGTRRRTEPKDKQ